jgi:hypothetical protein
MRTAVHCIQPMIALTLRILSLSPQSITHLRGRYWSVPRVHPSSEARKIRNCTYSTYVGGLLKVFESQRWLKFAAMGYLKSFTKRILELFTHYKEARKTFKLLIFINFKVFQQKDYLISKTTAHMEEVLI